MNYSSYNRMAMPFVQNSMKGDRLDMQRSQHPLASPRIVDILMGRYSPLKTRSIAQQPQMQAPMQQPMQQEAPAMQPAPMAPPTDMAQAGGPTDIIGPGYEDPSKRLSGDNWLKGLFAEGTTAGDVMSVGKNIYSQMETKPAEVKWLQPQMYRPQQVTPIKIGGLL